MKNKATILVIIILIVAIIAGAFIAIKTLGPDGTNTDGSIGSSTESTEPDKTEFDANGTENNSGGAAGDDTTQVTSGDSTISGTESTVPGTESTVPGTEPSKPNDDTSDETQACAHSWSSWSTKAATCTTDGYKTRSCSNCKKVESEAIKATGHSFGAWQVKTPATCEHGGMETRQCSKCSITSSRTTAATDHNWDSGVKTVVPTSCSEMGVIKYTCQTCGKTKTAQITGSHSFGSWTYEAYTYEIDASDIAPPGIDPIVTYTSHRKVRSCTKCGFKEYQNFGDHVCERGSVKHKVTIIKEPVCDTPGIKRSTCTICGWYEDFEYAPNTGISHKWVREEVHLSDYTQYTNELDATIATCSACGAKSVRYHHGKGYNEYHRWRVPVGVAPGTAYAEQYPMNDDFKWVDHPTWQMVTRDHVYDADGYVKQFTVYWHDTNGKRYSAVVKCGEGEMEALFASAGMTPSKKVTAWTVKIYGDTYGPYMIHYQ